jgi:hypothetical protein
MVRWLHYVIAYILPNTLDRIVESGISRQENDHATRMGPSHGADHLETVVWLRDVEVTNQKGKSP